MSKCTKNTYIQAPWLQNSVDVVWEGDGKSVLHKSVGINYKPVSLLWRLYACMYIRTCSCMYCFDQRPCLALVLLTCVQVRIYSCIRVFTRTLCVCECIHMYVCMCVCVCVTSWSWEQTASLSSYLRCKNKSTHPVNARMCVTHTCRFIHINMKKHAH